MKYTNEQIANDYRLWMQYVDPSGTMTESEFSAMPFNKRIEMIRECFPDENT